MSSQEQKSPIEQGSNEEPIATYTGWYERYLEQHLPIEDPQTPGELLAKEARKSQRIFEQSIGNCCSTGPTVEPQTSPPTPPGLSALVFLHLAEIASREAEVVRLLLGHGPELAQKCQQHLLRLQEDHPDQPSIWFPLLNRLVRRARISYPTVPPSDLQPVPSQTGSEPSSSATEDDSLEPPSQTFAGGGGKYIKISRALYDDAFLPEWGFLPNPPYPKLGMRR